MMNLINRESLLKRFPFLRALKKYYIFYTSPYLCPIYFHRDGFMDLPSLPDISPLSIKKMLSDNESEINEWLIIMNQSFSRTWGKADYNKNIINHNVYDVLNTYFLMDENKYVGAVSEGVFKLNNEMGVTHYLGLDRKYLGRGLGKYLILYTLHMMKEHGLKGCEGESSLKHMESLNIHFDFGFKPKLELDYWNTPNKYPLIIKNRINVRFKSLYYKRVSG